jgi:GNAT superfamily N-acetyltransferase
MRARSGAMILETADAHDVILREPDLGDLSWLMYRHMVTIAREQGWNTRYEGHLLEISSRFLLKLDPACERVWIAVRGDEILGCVGLVREDATTARLRTLFVEPATRGLGLGRRLVRTCVAFARQAGYGAVVLWTLDVLTAARALYASEGFGMVSSDTWDEIGPVLQDETWRLEL